MTELEQFAADLSEAGFAANQGSIVDANIVEASRQRNTRKENAQIKRGERPEAFDENPHNGRQNKQWTRSVAGAAAREMRLGARQWLNRGTPPMAGMRDSASAMAGALALGVAFS